LQPQHRVETLVDLGLEIGIADVEASRGGVEPVGEELLDRWRPEGTRGTEADGAGAPKRQTQADRARDIGE
jgi:hypothetical protein